MCRLLKLILTFVLVCLPKDALSLKDVILDIEPRVVQLGAASTLRCSYDLEDEPLYTVKWYRGHHEFYRYTPKELPSPKVFPFAGVHVDVFPYPVMRDSCRFPIPEESNFSMSIVSCLELIYSSESDYWFEACTDFYYKTLIEIQLRLKQSNEHQVVLREVGFNLSGNLSCEVTTDAPLFSTQVVSSYMLVVVLPSHPPSIYTEKNFYDIGDVLRANCSSSPSRPAAILTFHLNNIVVCEKCSTRKYVEEELLWSGESLELPLFPSHFQNGRLTLKCVAEIRDLYQQEAEINLYNVNDPIPARVVQSSANICHIAIFNIGLTTLIFTL